MYLRLRWMHEKMSEGKQPEVSGQYKSIVGAQTGGEPVGKIVVLAEKPSVGRDIARVIGCKTAGDGCLIGGKYIVTWAIGHLVSLAEPDEIDEKYKKWSFSTLPILPQKIPLKVLPSTRSQFQKVKKLINDKETDSLICATDAGREGELIFRYIYEEAGCRKPFDRLWISSMTDEAIKEGFRDILPGKEYEGLYQSALCRSHADWLVGMNASRAFSLKYNTLLSVGRVQTPTLAILVKRRKEIENFIPEGFCTLTADFGDYKGILFSEELDPDTHLKSRKAAEAAEQEVAGKTGIITAAETVRKHDLPPQLYDLTSLQRDANRLLGFTADKTLRTAQSLYETHKALTYPRTDSRYIPPDMIPRVIQTMKLLPDEYQRYVAGALPEGKLPVTKRTVDASKVTDHHAILPTAKRTDLSRLNQDERDLYDLVVRRLLAAFYPACDYDAVRIITEVNGYHFRTNGRTVINNGWRDIPQQGKIKQKKKQKNEEEEPGLLPELNRGEERKVKGTTIKEDQTKPPAPHTDASLLAAMETAGKELDNEELAREMKGSGIGTPATRAAVIERLIHVGYASRRGKTIQATDKGVMLIEIMPREIASPEMTGKWELALHEITDNRQDPARFMDGIRKMSSFLVNYAREESKDVVFPQDERKKRYNQRKSSAGEILEDVKCPVCGKGALRENSVAFGCTEPECKFTVWKDCLQRAGGPVLTGKLMTLLLEKKQLRGSTGILAIRSDRIEFTPEGSVKPSVSRALVYEKQNNRRE